MSRKRKHYNWIFIIEDYGLKEEFDRYCADNDFKHVSNQQKRLSLNRLARAFVKRRIKGLFSYLITSPCYEVGQEEPFTEWIKKNPSWCK